MPEAFTTLAQTTLSAAITLTGATSFTVTSGTSFPSTGTFRVRIDNEIIKITSNSAGTMTGVRADGGTTAATHTNGSTVTQVTTAEALYALQADTLGLAVQASLPGGRLTLTSGTPYTGDITGAPTIYWTPTISNVVALWDGSYWQRYTFTEPSLSIGTVSLVPQDVFLYASGSTPTLEKLAWTSATVRATAISIQDGRLCKTGDKTRLWVGSFYPSSTTTTEDSEAKPFLFNAYHRRPRLARGAGTYASDSTIATTTPVTLSSALDLQVFMGEAGDVFVDHCSSFKNTVSTGGGVQDAYWSVGLDGTYSYSGLFINDLGYPTFRRHRVKVPVSAGLHTLNYGWAFGAGGGSVGYDGTRGGVANNYATCLEAMVSR